MQGKYPYTVCASPLSLNTYLTPLGSCCCQSNPVRKQAGGVVKLCVSMDAHSLPQDQARLYSKQHYGGTQQRGGA